MLDHQKQIAETLAHALFTAGAIELRQRDRVASVLNANLWGLVELSGVLTPRAPAKVKMTPNQIADAFRSVAASHADLGDTPSFVGESAPEEALPSIRRIHQTPITNAVATKSVAIPASPQKTVIK